MPPTRSARPPPWSGLYNNGTVVNQASATVPITNNSTRRVSPADLHLGDRTGEPCADLRRADCRVFHRPRLRPGRQAGARPWCSPLSDGTHAASHTVSSLTASARQFSTSCTATNGSNVLTSCGATAGLWAGERHDGSGDQGPARSQIDRFGDPDHARSSHRRQRHTDHGWRGIHRRHARRWGGTGGRRVHWGQDHQPEPRRRDHGLYRREASGYLLD